MHHFAAFALAVVAVAGSAGAAGPSDKVEIGSPFEPSRKAPFAEKPGSVCKSIDTCAECVAEQDCGWCPESQTCVRGDANAPAAGNGTCGIYEYGLCKSEPCKLYPTCTSCLADPLCGWCASTGMCAEGHPDKGPLHMGRVCAGAWCHSPRFESRRETYVHAMLDDEIVDICENGCQQPHATGATGAGGATGVAGLLNDVAKSFPDLSPEAAAEAAEGGEVLEKAVEGAVSKAASKVPAEFRSVVEDSVKEAIESVSITPEEAAVVRAKARADLVTFEQSRLSAVREVKGKVEAEQEKIDVLLDRQEGDWPTAVSEASTVIANALGANKDLLSNDPESKRWTESVHEYLRRVSAQLESMFGKQTPEATRLTEQKLKEDRERAAAAEAGVAADAGETSLLAVQSRLRRRGRESPAEGSVAAALAKEFPGLTPEEAKVVSNLVPALGDGKGRVPALQAKLAAKRVIEGRRSAERAERDAEAYMDATLAAKQAAFESAEEEIEGAKRLNSTDIKREALKRLADAQMAYRTAVMGVESAVAKVKAMLSSDNAMLMTNGAAVVDEMAKETLDAKHAADAAQEAKEEREYHEKIEKKLAKQAKEEERQEEEVEKLSEQTDEQVVAAETA